MEKSRVRSKKPFLFMVTVVSFVILLLASSSVFADTVGPTYTDIYPANGAAINFGQVTLSIIAKDPDTVNSSSVVMTVDGNKVSPILEYGWIDEWTDDFTSLSIYYPATLSNGTHNVQVTAKDGAGNSSTYSWSFAVGQPPRISSPSPADGSVVTARAPVISAVITGGAPIDQGSMAMTVGGTAVPFSFDPGTGKVTYTPADNLANETTYNVSLAAKDIAGNSAQFSWKFTVNTYTEMTFSVDDSTCQQCHARTSHPMNSCSKCHGVNLDPVRPAYPLDDCYKCHFNAGVYPAAYHKSGLPYSMQPNHPVQTTDSCVVCHTKSWSTVIPGYHNVSNTADRHITTSTGCETCHARSLTREHQRRTDSAGNSLTCFTCHTNTDSRVQTAINNKDSSCAACHNLGAGGGHPAHNNGLDSYCQTCHSDSILTEQQFHQKNGCQVCHNAGAKDIVKYSISTKNTSCFSCHDKGHNVNFVQPVPADVPEYPGFTWSVPQDARIWAGEPWFDASYNTAGAKIVISSRLQSVNGVEVYNWYAQNMASNGWIKSAGADRGSDNFNVTYEKGIRKATIDFYGGETHDPASDFVGYRLEILYK